AERRVIRAPLTGRILQIKIHLGEYAQSGVVNPPLMLLGDDTRLHVRVDINENDAWRVKPPASAIPYVPGNPDLNWRLRFERIEPYAVPKASLTGESPERTDPRVLQVIHSFEGDAQPIYIGKLAIFCLEDVVTQGAVSRHGSTRGWSAHGSPASV